MTLLALAFAGLLANAPAPSESIARPAPRPTGPSIITQAIPSPEWILGGESTKFALKWQVTPVLYSFALRRELSPWRFFAVEPLARQGGSIETYFSPEYVTSGPASLRLIPRVGMRAYFPLFERGESLSVSLGTSYFDYKGSGGVGFEAGFYLVAGLIGGQVTWSPSHTGADWIVTLRLKYF